jgi:aspartyl-tRNA(Asn)/glutamyl-tRNA(Gln) amidotransferase subunit B
MQMNHLSSYKIIIGLEVHAQLSTRTKLFSQASRYSLLPNENFNAIDFSLPGTLPVRETYLLW